MALADRIELAKREKKVCPFQQMLNTMTKEDRETLVKAMKEGVPWRVLQRSLRAEGYSTSHETMTNHVRKTCRCRQ